MEMSEQIFNLWNNLTFKATVYGKNFDLTYENESFITEYDGAISEVRIEQNKPPVPVGEYQFSIWNINFAKELGIDLLDNLEEYEIEDSYAELHELLNNNEISLDKTNKLILLHTVVIHPNYRKNGVTEELIEFLYREYVYGNNNNQLISLVKPVQNNPVDFDYFWYNKRVKYKETISKNEPYKEISAKDYYNLEDFLNQDDTEMTEYKIFSAAKRCGFKRIGESYLFVLDPKNVINRIKEKRKELRTIDDIDELF